MNDESEFGHPVPAEPFIDPVVVAVPELVEPSEDTFWPLHPDSLRLSRWIGCGWIVVVTLIGVSTWGGGWALFQPTMTGLLCLAIAVGLFIGLVVFAGWFYPGAAYRHASWRINAEGLEIRRGVWWRHRIVVPHSRMQHSDIEQGPLQRMFSLATLVINTAGTEEASIQLSGLKFETAERLRDELVNGTWQPVETQ